MIDDCLMSVFAMLELGWGQGGETWKWRRRVFDWKEEMVGECCELLSNVVLQDDGIDKWQWRLELNKCYSDCGVYEFYNKCGYAYSINNNISYLA